ncbi:YlmH/Sll1252 family protein [Alkalibacter mobilis]|uniref:YlmH/Sll1252 family protein n=1 Tax=Alkalibacter mobilis TaxID=2787712 RepID=UPI00189F6E73|nr:YlmH/Sll1252 family protein [Alkalibacter mobilis]MBF7095868.1 hypothetical protein [Alkalibacter mobilis]
MKKYNDDDLIAKNIIEKASYIFDGVFYSDFLDPGIQRKISTTLDKMKVDHIFFGGYEDAERKILITGINNDDEKVPPIDLLLIENANGLTHRDILGSLLSTGIKRNVLGDIIVDEKNAYVFAKSNFSGYIDSNLEKIKSKYPVIRILRPGEVSLPEKRVAKKVFVISSTRLDNVISKVCSISRNESSALIKKGLVKLNHEVIEKPTVAVTENTLISIRGHGRYLISCMNGLTNKGNHKVEIQKYL